MDLALLVVRVVIGLLFVGHGSQKLFGAFGGAGLKGTADMFDAISLRPGPLHARAAGTAETVGGALLALGLLTPVAAALVIAVMVAGALAGVGAGQWSLDNALGIDWSSTGWALAALGAGVIGGLGTVITGRMSTAREAREVPPHPA